MSAATDAPAAKPARGPLLGGLVRWHVGLGELALRLFLLHLLWILGTLAGGVLLGLFPATAAMHAVIRADLRDAALERAGRDAPVRPRLWREFWAAWRAELLRSQLIGLVLLAGWGLILADRAILGAGVGAATPVVSGVVVVLTVVMLLVSTAVWPLAAHFSDPLPRLWRMTLMLLVRRPSLTLSLAALLGAAVWLLSSVPGLLPVFGIVLVCWAASFLIWRSGVLPVE